MGSVVAGMTLRHMSDGPKAPGDFLVDPTMHLTGSQQVLHG